MGSLEIPLAADSGECRYETSIQFDPPLNLGYHDSIKMTQMTYTLED